MNNTIPSFKGNALIYSCPKKLFPKFKTLVKDINSLDDMKETSKNLYMFVTDDKVVIKAGKDVQKACKYDNDLQICTHTGEKSVLNGVKSLLDEILWRSAIKKEFNSDFLDRIYYGLFPSESPVSKRLSKRLASDAPMPWEQTVLKSMSIAYSKPHVK